MHQWRTLLYHRTCVAVVGRTFQNEFGKLSEWRCSTASGQTRIIKDEEAHQHSVNHALSLQYMSCLAASTLCCGSSEQLVCSLHFAQQAQLRYLPAFPVRAPLRYYFECCSQGGLQWHTAAVGTTHNCHPDRATLANIKQTARFASLQQLSQSLPFVRSC